MFSEAEMIKNVSELTLSVPFVFQLLAALLPRRPLGHRPAVGVYLDRYHPLTYYFVVV